MKIFLFVIAIFFAIFLVVQKSMQEEPECRMVLCAQIEIPPKDISAEAKAGL